MGIVIPKKLKEMPRRTLYICAVVLITSGGLFWWRPGRVHAQTDTFVTSGTWTVPANVYSAVFEAWGGGGAGGGTSSNSTGGTGGGGGDYAKTTLTGLNTNDSYTITVGSGGSASTGNGSNGGDSYVVNPASSTFVMAAGGNGGKAGCGIPGCNIGGSGSTSAGDVTYNGGSASFGSTSSATSGSGGGGAGSTGIGGNASGTTAGSGSSANGGNGGAGGTGNYVGAAGSNYGGGGSGASKSSGSSKQGGAGAQGLVTVTYTVGNSPPGAPNTQDPAPGGVTASTTPYLIMNAVDSNGDTVKYKALIYNTTANSGGNCSGSLLETGDQTASGTGWDNGTTAYASNAYATYSIQSTLTRGSGYCWQAQAIDPGGSNTFGNLSTASIFTVSNGPLTAGFETGANNSALSTSDSGNVTPFDAVNCSSAGNSLTYSNTTVKSGLLASKYVFGGTNPTCNWSWSSNFGSQNDYYGRGYFNFSSIPSSYFRIFTGSSGGAVWSIAVDTSGNIEISGRFGDVLGVSTNTITPSQWFRIEMHIAQGPNNGSLTVRLFLSPDSTTPSETLATGNVSSALGTSTSSLTFGDDIFSALTFYTDAIAMGADNWLGPANSVPNAPTLSSPTSGAIGVSTTPSFTLSAVDPDSDNLKYRLYLYQSDCSSAVGTSPFAQSSSGTGWDNGTTAYTSGSTAVYTYQGTLANNTQYCWKADAIDPTGSSTYGTASTTRLFTTAGSSGGAVIQGGVDIRGGSTIQ
jgi:hypothetical protein